MPRGIPKKGINTGWFNSERNTGNFNGFKKGEKSKNWNGFKKGFKHSKETRNKMSQTRKQRNIQPPHFKLDEHPNWKGGISFENYTNNWTETLRRSIRERDNYICRICLCTQGDIAHDVHHIDYDKKNCDPNNLVTLCHSCHMKTNYNRSKWKIFFIK